jgi:hypothetical protein
VSENRRLLFWDIAYFIWYRFFLYTQEGRPNGFIFYSAGLDPTGSHGNIKSHRKSCKMTNPTRLAGIKEALDIGDYETSLGGCVSGQRGISVEEDIEYLVARVEKLEAALKFYVDHEDYGERARKVLEDE